MYPDQLVTLVRGDRKKFAKGTMDLGVEFFFPKVTCKNNSDLCQIVKMSPSSQLSPDYCLHFPPTSVAAASTALSKIDW